MTQFGPRAYDSYVNDLLTKAYNSPIFMARVEGTVKMAPHMTAKRVHHKAVSYRQRQARHRKN